MELEQNASFLKIKTEPQAAILPITIGPIEAESPLDSGFATLMEEDSKPSEIQDGAVPAISFAQTFHALPDETPAPDFGANASLSSEVIDPSEEALSEATIVALPSLANPGRPSQIEATPLDIDVTELDLPRRPSPSVFPAENLNVANPAPPAPNLEPKPGEISAPTPDGRTVKATEKAVESFPIPIPSPKSNLPVAAAPVAASLAEFFEPLADKKSEQPLVNTAKEPLKIDASRVFAPQSTPATLPAIVQPAAQGALMQIESGVEPDFTITLKSERFAFDSSALLPQAARTAAPIQAQIASQFPTQIAANSQKAIELRLDPPELGRVVIHITTQDQSVTAQIVADRPDTLELMRRHAEFFTNTLDKAGFPQSNLSFQQGGSQPPQKPITEFQLGQADLLSEDLPIPTTPARLIEGRLDIRL